MDGVSVVNAPWSGPIPYSGMALAAASTPSVRPGGRTSSCEGPAWVRGKLCMAVGRRACPSRQLRRRSTSWSSSVSDYMTSTQAPSRLKQIDGPSCTGNVNLLKLGGRPARPLKGFHSGLISVIGPIGLVEAPAGGLASRVTPRLLEPARQRAHTRRPRSRLGAFVVGPPGFEPGTNGL